MRTSPTPSHTAGSSPSSSAGAATLISTATLTPSAVTAGLWRNAAAACAARFACVARVSNAACVAGSGSSQSCARSPSTKAVAPAGSSRGSTPSPTIIGTPRARASVATWPCALPCVSAMAPPRLQSVDRKREGERSRASRIAPAATLASSAGAAQRGKHAVADIGEIAGAGAEMLVVGGLVVRHLSP